MRTYFTTPVRVLILAVALAFATPTVEAHSTPTNHHQTTARTGGETGTADHGDGVSLDGVVIVAFVVGVVVLLAWVCSRVSDQ